MPNSNTYMREYMARRRSERRRKLTEFLGGVCAVCGTADGLEIDHLDPTLKDFRLTGKDLDRPWAKVLEEAAKCQLLCGTHHAEKTANERPPWRHGTLHGYFNRRCKCEPCRTRYSSWRKTSRRAVAQARIERATPSLGEKCSIP